MTAVFGVDFAQGRQRGALGNGIDDAAGCGSAIQHGSGPFQHFHALQPIGLLFAVVNVDHVPHAITVVIPVLGVCVETAQADGVGDQWIQAADAADDAGAVTQCILQGLGLLLLHLLAAHH